MRGLALTEISERTTLVTPAINSPQFRTTLAVHRGVERNLLIKTWGGLGDQICAEPALRFALRTFKGCKISLASEQPALFQHLPFERVFDLNSEQPIWAKYLVFDTIKPPTDIQWEFMCHMTINCVDYPALCAFRCQLPVADREVRLVPTESDTGVARNMLYGPFVPEAFTPYVAVHPGRHWQSKTFPKAWWDAVISCIADAGCVPVLIGGDTDDNRGTVQVETSRTLDLRGKLSVMQSVALLQTVPVLLTNDSAPLHMAASGAAWIGYVATCKHPDYISHWRFGQWSWRMKNFGLSGIWDVLDYCPNKDNEVSAENVGDALLASWLPKPEDFAGWATEKARKLETSTNAV